MVAAMLAQAVSLLPLLAVQDRSDLPVVYGVIVAQATFATVVEPAKNATLPTLVGPERLVSANALVGLDKQQATPVGALGSVFAAVGLAQALGQAVGLLVGGVLPEVIGTLPLMEVQAGLYVAAALLAVVLLPRTARPVAARSVAETAP